ncbi:MAG: signal peptide peptidase SppA [Actinobacteria bacterium]|nr:signal peptide peptidase SppA [Actinomycetota bacterium]
MRATQALRGARMGLLALAAGALSLAALLGLLVLATRAADRPGGLLLSLVGAAAVLAVMGAAAAAAARRIPPRTVLELDLREPLRDDPLAAAMARRPSLRDVVETLARAGADKRVAGLVARIGTPATGVADVQELRGAVAAFRATGKFALAHADTFGEFAPANTAYHLACAFSEISVQPSGDVGLTGVAAEVGFLRGALDKLGVQPRLDHRHEYKNAKNVLTETGFTPAHREATRRVVDSLFTQLVDAVAEGRGLPASTVRGLVDRAPLFGAEAVEAGLVDRLAYRDEVVDRAEDMAGQGARLLSLADYRRRSHRERGRASTVAVVHGSGAVVRGRGRPGPLPLRAMGSDAVTSALRRAAADRGVKAILFRVDSPGGSYVASDAIWHATVRAREAGTPVVVSMGNVAGSGGYFVAMAADRIVAHPATLTGSIGVVGGKPVLAGLKDKLGIATGQVHAGDHALLGSVSRDFTDGEWRRLQRWLDRVYDDFTAKVAQGRGLPIERVREVARGRIWTGADAHGHGLVDELGGYASALRAVREVAGLPADARLRLKPFPRRRSLLARALGRGRGDDDGAGPGAAASLWASALAPPVPGGEQVLRMPRAPTIR